MLAPCSWGAYLSPPSGYFSLPACVPSMWMLGEEAIIYDSFRLLNRKSDSFYCYGHCWCCNPSAVCREHVHIEGCEPFWMTWISGQKIQHNCLKFAGCRSRLTRWKRLGKDLQEPGCSRVHSERGWRKFSPVAILPGRGHPVDDCKATARNAHEEPESKRGRARLREISGISKRLCWQIWNELHIKQHGVHGRTPQRKPKKRKKTNNNVVVWLKCAIEQLDVPSHYWQKSLDTKTDCLEESANTVKRRKRMENESPC